MEDLAKWHQISRMRHKYRTPPGRMDVDDKCRAIPEKFVEQTFDKDKWIYCACWENPRVASRSMDVYRVWLKFQVR
jgi:hypothetical protein